VKVEAAGKKQAVSGIRIKLLGEAIVSVNKRALFVFAILLISMVAIGATAQAQTQSLSVPRLVKFSSTLLDASGQPHSQPGTVNVVFAIYSAQTGGQAIWQESQNVQVDAQGHYMVLLGSSQPDGLPAGLFNTGEARWLGVQVQSNGDPEQTRVSLVSVPYALKAADAETLGGKPASAYALASVTALSNETSRTRQVFDPTAAINNGGSNGTVNFVSKFDSSSTLINSQIFDDGINVGIGTNTPVVPLDIRDNGVVNIPPNLPTVLINQSKDAADGLVAYANGVNGEGSGVHGVSYGELGGTGVWGESKAQNGTNYAGIYGSTEGSGVGGWFEAYPDDVNAQSTALLARSFGVNTVAAVFNNTSGGKILSLQTGDVGADNAASAPEVLSVVSNGNLTTIGSVTASSFHGDGSGLTNLPASAITGNLTASNGGTGVSNFAAGLILKSSAPNTWNAGSLQVSDLPPAANYVFATDHTFPYVQLTGATNPAFADVTFDTNVKINGWTHTTGTPDFVASQSGTYQIHYSAAFYTSPTSPDPASGIEIRAMRTTGGNSTAVTDANIAAYDLNPSLTNLGKSFIVDMAVGDSLKLQWAELFEGEIACVSSSQPTSNPIISITISRIQ
jgi:trimeric autotransporter adhesin